MELVILILLLAVAVAAGVAVITVLHRVTKEDERILAEQAAATAAVAETTEAAEEDGAATEAVVAEEVEESTPVETAEEVSAEEVTEADEATEAELNGDSVTFSAAKETLSQKYDALSDELKDYYGQIVATASAVEGNRCFKNDRYEEYKVGKNRIVRLLIKRGVIVCEFVIANNDLRNYMSDNKLKLKQAPTTLKVFDEATLAAAKATMEIAVKAIEDEKAYKKEQARAKRKAAKAAAEAEATAVTETTTDAE